MNNLALDIYGKNQSRVTASTLTSNFVNWF